MTETTFTPATNEDAARLIDLVGELSDWIRDGRSMGLGDVSIANGIRAKFLDRILDEWCGGTTHEPLPDAQLARLEARRLAVRDQLRASSSSSAGALPPLVDEDGPTTPAETLLAALQDAAAMAGAQADSPRRVYSSDRWHALMLATEEAQRLVARVASSAAHSSDQPSGGTLSEDLMAIASGLEIGRDQAAQALGAHVANIREIASRLRSHPGEHRAEGEPLPDDAELIRLRPWMRNVVEAWSGYWRQKPDHRYGKDFASFVGERLMTDFELRDIAAARSEVPPSSLSSEPAGASETTSEPARHDQVPDGCWVACIAGLTGLDHETLTRAIPRLPDGSCDGSMGTEYRNTVNAYLRANGWRLVHTGTDAPRGFAIGGGKSPRGVDHAVIVRDGDLWHDPHPSRAGVVALEDYEILIRVRPAVDAWAFMRKHAPECYAYAQFVGLAPASSPSPSILQKDTTDHE